MNNAASFNLLKFVERRPRLSAGKIMCAIILCAVMMAGYFLFQVDRVRYGIEESSKVELAISQITQTLQPLLQQGVGNPMVGVLPFSVPKGRQEFYPEFEALTHIQVKGLWLERVVIQRHPAFIKITGAVETPDQVDQLLRQLAAQPAFKNIQFIDVVVSKGLLPSVPEQYREAVKQLEIPVFYHFTIQTARLKQSALKKAGVSI